MNNDILEAIAINSAFGTDEVHRVFEIFKSYDLLVAACEFAKITGCANLETACILVKSAQQERALDKCACGNPKSPESPCCAECIQEKKDALASNASRWAFRRKHEP